MSGDDVAADSSASHGPGHGCAATIQLLSDLFSASPTFAAVGEGPDLVLRFANPAYERMVGRTSLLGRPVREALPELESQGFVDHLERVLATGEPYVGHHVPIRYHPDPSAPELVVDRVRDFVYQPLFDGRGKPWAVFANGVDVTERLELQARLAASDMKRHEAELRLDHERRDQFDFLSGLARDLSNPESKLRHGVTAARRAGNPDQIESVAAAFDRQWVQLLQAVRMQLEALRKALQDTA